LAFVVGRLLRPGLIVPPFFIFLHQLPELGPAELGLTNLLALLASLLANLLALLASLLASLLANLLASLLANLLASLLASLRGRRAGRRRAAAPRLRQRNHRGRNQHATFLGP